MNNKKTLFFSIVTVLVIGLMLSGGTFAFLQWSTNSAQRTNIYVNIPIDNVGMKMVITPEGGQLEAKGLKPVTDCMESYAYFDSTVKITNSSGSLAVPSFKLKARVKPNSASGAAALKKADLAHIHYTVVEISSIGQAIKTDKSDNSGARRCYEPSHIQKNGTARNGWFLSSSNESSIATGTFANMSHTLDANGWTTAINLPSSSSQYLARQYNNDAVKGDLGAWGITMIGGTAVNGVATVTTKYFRVYVWIDGDYTYTNVGGAITDPLANAVIEVNWSTDTVLQQVSG